MGPPLGATSCSILPVPLMTLMPLALGPLATATTSCAVAAFVDVLADDDGEGLDDELAATVTVTVGAGVGELPPQAPAVPATMDGAGILYDRKDEIQVAALIDAIVDGEALRTRIIDGQNAALDRLRQKDFAGSLLHFVAQVRSAPPAAAAVTADFWRQFDQAERLEQLRLCRPSIYRALPEEKG